jgi:hypothetical protein
MPKYLAPGVYVEETSFRTKSIEGVSTTTAGFIGPARYGPLDLEPAIITSLGEFERVYGDRQKLNFKDTGPLHNYLWHAVRAFFEEGGNRLYIARSSDPNMTKTGRLSATVSPAPSCLQTRFKQEARTIRWRRAMLTRFTSAPAFRERPGTCVYESRFGLDRIFLPPIQFPVLPEYSSRG